MFWSLLLGRALADTATTANEAAGKALLPLQTLQNLFIAPCFQNTGTPTDRTWSDAARLSVKTCLDTSVIFYGNRLMGVAVIICFVYIVRAGYIMFTAFGDEAKYAAGKKTLLYAVIGLAIAVAAGFMINFFVGLLGYDPKA